MNIDGKHLIDIATVPNTPEEERRARLYICGHARDTREAAAFLLMLGLAPA